MSLSSADRRSLRPSTSTRPLGPRSRPGARASTVPGPEISPSSSLQRRSVQSTTSRDSTLYSPVPMSPVTESSQKSIHGEPESRPPTPATPATIASVHSTHSYSPSPSPAPSMTRSAQSALQKVPTLIAPSIKFESTTISFKSLPLEAALWTFDSKELQTIVSRAIRSSAKESFVRLLSVKNLDTFIPAEIERLQSLKATQQSRYRFNVQRRTMLLQALVSFSTTNAVKEEDGGAALVGRLATQLSEITTACDSLAEELVNITDQLTQLYKLVDTHWASALAIALRKLNSSYGRRTSELNTTRARISQLEAELEDAWKAAEKMAQEMDDMDAMVQSDDEEDETEERPLDEATEILDEGTTVIDRAEVVSVSSSAPLSNLRMSGTLISIPPTFSPVALLSGAFLTDDEPAPYSPETKSGEEEQLEEDTPPPPPPKDVDDSDKVSIRSRRSAKSTKSHRSTRSMDTNRVSIISAARIRSQRTSIASLRLPRNLRQLEYPPVPDIPKHLSPQPPSSFHPPRSGNRRSFLHLESPDVTTPTDGDGVHQRTSIDDLQLVMQFLATDGTGFLSRPQSTVDDIYVMPPRTALADDDIEEVPRTPARRFRRSVDDVSMIMSSTRLLSTPNDTVPSIWLNSDMPKTPAERVEILMQEDGMSSKPSSYSRLKTFTKRYSMTMPFHRLMAMSPIKSHR